MEGSVLRKDQDNNPSTQDNNAPTTSSPTSPKPTIVKPPDTVKPPNTIKPPDTVKPPATAEKKTPEATEITKADVPAFKPVTPELSRDQRIMEELELRFMQIKELGAESFFSHEAICKKCGWHTMQNTRDEAYQLITSHLIRHWKDVALQIK